jgi:FdhD protein
MNTLRPPVRQVSPSVWRHAAPTRGSRAIAEEVAVAFTYNKCAYAVMMATPADLEDFAVGFSLSEGVISARAQMQDLEIVPREQGIELRIWIDEQRSTAFSERRRYLAGPSGCGLCGLESLEDAMRPSPRVESALKVSAAELASAMASMPALQRLNRQTRAQHAAAFWTPDRGIVALREDVGRHNALDKLGGALARSHGDVAVERGALLLTSRVSVEMVQKAARLGVPIILAVSAPTSLAIQVAQGSGITLIGIARDDGFECFTHAQRILFEASADVS